jgi:hypothetical protein
MLHFEALDRKLRGVATEADLDKIWRWEYGNPDLYHDVPETSEEALARYYQESQLRDEYIDAAQYRRNQFNRQIAVGAKKLEDPVLAEKLDAAQQSFRDARKYLTFTTPSNSEGEIDYLGGHPDRSRMGDSLARLRPRMSSELLNDSAADAWNFMRTPSQAGALPAIEALVDYNRYITKTHPDLVAGLGDNPYLSSTPRTSPITKGGYLGSNFAPQLEALWEKATLEGKIMERNYRNVQDRYLIDPKFRSAVNRFIPNTLRTPTAGAVGGLLSMAGQAIDSTDPDYMNRNYRGTDPLSIRPLYDLLLAPASGQSYSDAGRAYERMVADPEYVQRNPLSSMVGQAVRGDPQYLKAFLNAYNPFQ